MFDHVETSGIKEFAGQTFAWLGEDNQENFRRHCSEPQQLERLQQHGWLSTDIEYRFNREGFRSQEFDPAGGYFCAFGCSFTFGTAIQQQQRYTDLVSQQTGVTAYNFGVQGSNDSASFRLAVTWLDRLQPQWVIYQSTFPQRFEVIDNNQAICYGVNAALGGRVPTDHGRIYKQIMSTEANGELLALKNLWAMRELCRSKNIKLIEISYIDFLKTHDNNARDLHHPGPRANQSVAQLVLEQL